MVGEEMQRCDDETRMATCRVALGTYNPVAHYVDVVLPFKEVKAVTFVNPTADTHFILPNTAGPAVAGSNVMRIHARKIADNTEADVVDLGSAEVGVVLPYD